jgi:hypothetical protein
MEIAMAENPELALEESAPPLGTEKGTRRKIPGGLPYTSSPGVLKRILDKIPTSEKPGTFSPDFLGTVMGTTGGAARPIIPILKATGLLNQSGAPTEIYSQFQTEAGRAGAALQALKNGFAEIFRRNQYAHRADENTLMDVIVSITGLPRKENIVRYILNTFQVFQEPAKGANEDDLSDTGYSKKPTVDENPKEIPILPKNSLQLAYNINIVLPETTNIDVYNAIFKSIRGNLLN